jgi:hypothetical protein
LREVGSTGLNQCQNGPVIMAPHFGGWLNPNWVPNLRLRLRVSPIEFKHAAFEKRDASNSEGGGLPAHTYYARGLIFGSFLYVAIRGRDSALALKHHPVATQSLANQVGSRARGKLHVQIWSEYI